MKFPVIKNTLGVGIKALLLFGMITPFAFAFDYPEAGDSAAGAKAWSENCSRCHNMRSPSELRDDQWLTTVFHMRVRAGLTGQETRDILTFLQASNAKIETVSNDANTVSTNDAGNLSGKQVYESNCVACHGANGKGSLPGVPDFTDKKGRLSKPDSQLISSITNGYQSPGSVMAMPPKGGNSTLSSTDVSAVLDYIRKSFGE
ncbi:cytochrome c5 family protein [Stutzerimonas chloritidismutans]